VKVEFSARRFREMQPDEKWKMLNTLIEKKRREIEAMGEELEGFLIYLEGREVYYLLGRGRISPEVVIEEAQRLLRQAPH